MAKIKDITSRPARDGLQYSSDFAVAYLNILVDDAGEEELTAALGRIARASGGTKLVEKVELNAPSLYRTLCRRGNPELKTAVALLKAMGIRRAEQDVVAELSARDAADKSRPISPLKQAPDADLLDTSDLGIDAAFAAALALVSPKVEGALKDRHRG